MLGVLFCQPQVAHNKHHCSGDTQNICQRRRLQETEAARHEQNSLNYRKLGFPERNALHRNGNNNSTGKRSCGALKYPQGGTIQKQRTFRNVHKRNDEVHQCKFKCRAGNLYRIIFGNARCGIRTQRNRRRDVGKNSKIHKNDSNYCFPR